MATTPTSVLFIINRWKPVTFLVGLTWLFWGATFLHYHDWDFNLSVLMAGCTYLTAEQFIASWQ